MVAERELPRVRVEIGLPEQILHVVAAHVVADQGDRHDQGHETAAMIVDAGEQFIAIRGVDQPLEVPDHVRHDVGMAPGRREAGERTHERSLVLIRHLAGAPPGDVGHALRQLEPRRLVRSVHCARAQRYEHHLDKVYSITAQQQALLAVLMLRGPQTLAELMTRSERMAKFNGSDDVRHTLERLADR